LAAAGTLQQEIARIRRPTIEDAPEIRMTMTPGQRGESTIKPNPAKYQRN
jgi:hypothetical protein